MPTRESPEGGDAVDEATRRISLRAVLALVAVVAVAAVFWAASALAAGGGSGSSGSDGGARDSPSVANVQNGDGERDGDCPNRAGESPTSSDI
jgi:hypothetical protein